MMFGLPMDDMFRDLIGKALGAIQIREKLISVARANDLLYTEEADKALAEAIADHEDECCVACDGIMVCPVLTLMEDELNKYINHEPETQLEIKELSRQKIEDEPGSHSNKAATTFLILLDVLDSIIERTELNVDSK